MPLARSVRASSMPPVWRGLYDRLPPPRVIRVDELGPIAVKTYPGAECKARPECDCYEPDDGGDDGRGGSEPLSNRPRERPAPRSPRSGTHGPPRLTGKVVQQSPSDRWLHTQDNLSIHTSKQTRRALAAWTEIQVQLPPKATPSQIRASAEPHRALVEPTPDPGINGPLVCIYGRTGAGATRGWCRLECSPAPLSLEESLATGRNARNSRSSLINRQSTDERRSKELAERIAQAPADSARRTRFHWADWAPRA